MGKGEDGGKLFLVLHKKKPTRTGYPVNVSAPNNG